MSFEELLTLNPHIWPLAVMAFLRIITIFFFLPILGDRVITAQTRIAISLVFTICLWSSMQDSLKAANNLLQWSPLTLAIATFREVTFGFATAFSARMILYAANIGSHLVGVNMGFQTGTLFSQVTNSEESSYSVFHGWIAVMLILILNIHHIFFEAIATGFKMIPIGPIGDGTSLAQAATKLVSTSFLIGLKLATPILVVQILINIALGCLTRAVPQLNVFVLGFPISFLISMLILFFGTGMYIRYVSFQGMQQEVHGFSVMQQIFKNPDKQKGK